MCTTFQWLVLTFLVSLILLGGGGHAARHKSSRPERAGPRSLKSRPAQYTPVAADLVSNGGDAVFATESAVAPLPAEEDPAPGEEYLQMPFPEELSDGSTMVVTVDGRISKIGGDGARMWTAEAGGPMVSSFQNSERRRPYAIIPQLDGRGVVHLQGTGKKTFTRIPITVKAFADLVPQYSHTPDGINYRKDESQLLVYIDWETGASDVIGCKDPSDPRCHRALADGGVSSRAQLFLTRVTTNIYATDVYTRESIFNFSYSEFRPVSMLHPHRMSGPHGGPLFSAGGLKANESLDSFSDGTVLGSMGSARLDTLVFDAFRVSQSMHKGPLSASMGNSLGGAAEDLIVSAPRYPYDPTVIFRKIPVKQHFGNAASAMGILGRLPLPSNNENYGESSDGGNSYYAYATSDSGVCDAALSRVLGTESTKTDALAEVGSEGDLISVVNGGSEFGLFAVTYSGARLSSPLVRGLLPSPSDSAIDSPKAFDDMAALRGVCIPVDSAAGYFYGSDQDNIFSRSVDDKTPVDECATGRGVEPIGAQCPASSNYFIHEVVTSADRSGMFASSDMQGSSGSKGIGASVVDLDLLFDNVVKHTSMDSRPADVEQASNRSQLDTATTALVVVAHAYDVIQSMAAKISQKTATLAIFIVTLLLWLMRPSMATSNIGAVSLPKLAVDTSLNVTDPSRVARVVGNIHITENLLGVGSSGTLVYFGFTSELGIMRPAAIKQMLKSNYSHAIKEIANLKKIDAHDNIVNYYMCEQNDNFVFLALQLCRMNLKDFVVRLERRLPPAVLRLRLCPAHADGVRASLLQAAEAVEFLHRRGVLHRDIKPHNILMEEVQSKPHAHIGSCVMFGASDIDINDIADMSMFKMRVSDFGLSKDVRAEELSFGSLSLDGKSLSGAVEEQKNSDKYLSRPPGSTRQWDAVGTIGWQAPELIKRRMRKLAGPLGEDASQEDDGDQLRLTSKVDIFALGCVLHFTLVPGCHPFGHWRDREDNIVRDTSDLSLLARTPDAFDLVSSMIHRDPQLRPTAREICFHPFFWNSQKRLDFWEALYCRLRKEGAKSRLIRELEVYADPVVHRHDTLLSDLDKQRGCFGWGAVLDVAFQREIDNPPHGIVYDVTSVYSCIRFIRHKKSHFDELDGRIRTLLSLPQGYMRYFESRLPRLFLYTVWFAVNYLANEKEFQKFDLQVMSRATYFSSVAPPVVITKDVPTPFLVLKADPDMKSINNGPCINERQLPSCVLRTLQNADNNADEENSGIRRRGYYEWSLDAMSKVNKMASEVEKSVTILPSRGEQWARGVVVDAFSSESAKERERTGPIQDRVMSLLYSNIFIPPRVNRPLHIKKALENERYRTDLCREWEESGKDQFCIGRSSRDDIDGLHAKYQPGSKHQHCKFRRGQKQCDYAHGRIELRAKGMQRITSGFSNVGRYVSGDIVDAWGHCDHFK